MQSGYLPAAKAACIEDGTSSDSFASYQGDIDTTFQTQQRDMFTSGLAARIGTHAFVVWCAIKSHSDFQTGEAWPGIRRLMALTGLASATAQKAVKTLLGNHLLRVVRKRGRSQIYIARERLDVRVGQQVICTIVIDYVPSQMRKRLLGLKGATGTQIANADVWADVEILPGPGMKYDPSSQTTKGRLLASDVPANLALAAQHTKAIEAKAQIKELANQLRAQRVSRPDTFLAVD